MNVISKKMSPDEIETLKAHLDKCNATYKKTPQYALFQASYDDCTITAYNSGKVVFQGARLPNNASIEPMGSINHSQLGSDEVGTGDYFGPLVVVACLVTKENEAFVKELHIDDSKKISDAQILKLAPQLMARLPYKTQIVDNVKYNQMHQKYNMNQLKAILHNNALRLVLEEHQAEEIIVDQFTPPKSYYQYLTNEKKVVQNIHFETKAESKYLSVAAASIIARYTFLVCMGNLSQKWDFPFPKGAGAEVDKQAKTFIETYGEKHLLEVAKVHFANTKKAKELMKHE